ncbi:hypothetical protein SK069_15380 [Patulibacter brassicae]|uniref:Orc1-like AAA ATPase domain-containing protein n=1 Tax=Patulibacter brassicae TaxID=1705717 RepID=A0ABU4VMC7_9ACTN|nr:AAA family ATPase [Patulibacter brassicae]MDX8152980.1 hypothetical protein [Patulibacter brassicae]
MQRLATEGGGTLLERGAVLEALRRGAAVRPGEPARALLLTGAVGMGKTSVVRALAATFDDGVRVLPARGRPGVAAWPFGVAAEALGPAVAADPALLSGPAPVAAPAAQRQGAGQRPRQE